MKLTVTRRHGIVILLLSILIQSHATPEDDEDKEDEDEEENEVERPEYEYYYVYEDDDTSTNASSYKLNSTLPKSKYTGSLNITLNSSIPVEQNATNASSSSQALDIKKSKKIISTSLKTTRKPIITTKASEDDEEEIEETLQKFQTLEPFIVFEITSEAPTTPKPSTTTSTTTTMRPKRKRRSTTVAASSSSSNRKTKYRIQRKTTTITTTTTTEAVTESTIKHKSTTAKSRKIVKEKQTTTISPTLDIKDLLFTNRMKNETERRKIIQKAVLGAFMRFQKERAKNRTKTTIVESTTVTSSTSSLPTHKLLPEMDSDVLLQEIQVTELESVPVPTNHSKVTQEKSTSTEKPSKSGFQVTLGALGYISNYLGQSVKNITTSNWFTMQRDIYICFYFDYCPEEDKLIQYLKKKEELEKLRPTTKEPEKCTYACNGLWQR